MTLAYTYDGDVLTHNVAPTGIDIPQRAENGEASFGGIPIEDPAGSLTLLGHRPFIVEDSACAAQPRLWTGYVTQRDIGRSLDRGMFIGAAPRLMDTTIVDSNAIFGFRQITGIDGNRGAETWGVRLTWILGSAYLTGLISTNQTWVISSALPMEAADYRKGYPSAVLSDLADRITKPTNWFAFWDPAGPEVRLFFKYDTETIGNCTKRISNVDGDIDSSTTFAPDSVAKLQREPDQTYSGVTVEYANGSVYRYRASTANTYIARDTTISRPYTGSAATAQAQAELFLDAHAVEVDRITCSIQVPAVSVGLIRAGQAISVKFSHLPGYETFVWMRIVACSPKPTNDKADFYDVALELVGARPASTVPSFLIAVQANYWIALQEDLSTHGWTKAWDNWDIGATSVIACGAGPPCGQSNSMWYRAVVPGESATVATFKLAANDRGGMWVYEVAGVNIAALTSVHDMVWQDDPSTIAVGATVSAASVLFGVISLVCVTYWSDGCSGWAGVGDEMLHTAAGTGLVVSKDSLNSCGNDGCPPINWIGYTQGTGALTISADAAANGGGMGAYNCGWNVGRGALILPILPGATFAIVQSAYGGDAGSGGTYSVVLPAPPTGSASTTGGGDDTTATLPPPPITTHTTDPTVDDDSDAGYSVTDTWVNTTSGEAFVLVDNTNGAAVWTSTTSTGTWAPTTTDYLVGTAQAALSAEIVVGTTPGGELGGTWASPTVDATHSGSAHLALGSTSSTAAAGDHTHAGYTGELLITDTPAGSPLVFEDILQNEAGDELLYAG